ncbi:protein yippee-like OJ1003C07.11 isoform X1 [Zea mays]|uniref:protein yippee-like OJ1003C07.11 isoform X1 n=1 Tax=Zea mays TaxID=4577 RepID=UPI000182B4C0|nr:protein yippee-like OJ1003C07.11 isoform X1 [Zea mays]|eukprot:XP_008658619.1 protein yippee-like OJ1003C07.11 isoform X1 [Zea mays]
MGLLFLERLEGEGVFRCRRCRVDAASKDAIISRDFYGRSGRAYLFDHVVNICLGPNEDRYLVTGLHTVNDIYCSCCQQILGWRYKWQELCLIIKRRVQKTHCTGPRTETRQDRLANTT